MTKSNSDKKLLSPLEVGARLSIPSKKVLSLCKSGKLPYFQFGDSVRVDENDLSAFVANSKKSEVR